MKRSLADILIENSKVTKKVNGELSTPSVDNIHTPDNHTSGRKSRAVDGKRGLGDRKSGKVAQVTPPKKGEKRKMREEAARMTNSAGPAQGNGRTPAGKRSVPGTITNTKGNQKNRDEGIAKRKRMASPVVPARSLDEGLGDNPDSKASMPFSKARNKDEGMKKPAVAKGKGVARGARIGTVGDNKKNPANIGKTRKMDKSYMGGVSAPVAKIKEGLEDLADFLETPLRINRDVVESNYPDGMDHSYLDDDGSDAAYEEAAENMKYEIQEFLKNEGAGYIGDYQKYLNHPKGKEDPTWYLENLELLVEAAYEVAMDAVRTEGFDIEVDEGELKPMLVQFMKGQDIPDDHIKAAFSNYMHEASVAEDNLDSSGYENTLSDAKYALQQKGFQVAGGGMTGGQMMFKNREGVLATVDVNLRRPEDVQGWMVKGNGTKQEGTDVQQLVAYINRKPKKKGMMSRLKSRVMGEMSSGGAVGSGAIASSAGGKRPKGSLFAGEMEEAHGTSAAFMQWTRHVDGAETEDQLYDMEMEFKKDRRLTHDEIAELQSTMYRRIDREFADKTPQVAEDDDPCWDSHKKVGTKMKGGKRVNDCVPKSTNESRYGRWSRK